MAAVWKQPETEHFRHDLGLEALSGTSTPHKIPLRFTQLPLDLKLEAVRGRAAKQWTFQTEGASAQNGVVCFLLNTEDLDVASECELTLSDGGRLQTNSNRL